MSKNPRHREDHALEVLDENRNLLGWLTSHKGDWDLIGANVPVRALVQTFDYEWKDADAEGEVAISEYTFYPIIVSNSTGWKDDVPLYATSYKNHARRLTVYEWKALVVTPSEHEWLFDLPQFEPVETEHDLDLKSAFELTIGIEHVGLKDFRVEWMLGLSIVESSITKIISSD